MAELKSADDYIICHAMCDGIGELSFLVIATVLIVSQPALQGRLRLDLMFLLIFSLPGRGRQAT